MLIGITGGIGMGKSTVLRDFVRLGGQVADADEIAHSLYTRGSTCHEAMVSRWGRRILDSQGCIDRSVVGSIVFGDASELSWLNGLLHPAVRAVLRGLDRGRGCLTYCAVPLLYESGMSGDMDVVVSVWCSPAVQHARLVSRGWSEEEISRRLGSQLSADEKLRRSDYGIISDCSWSELHRQCSALHSLLSC